jgi:regulator of sigma E protease
MPADFFHSLLAHVWSILLVTLFLGSSIFVHELGHFLAARRRGLRVERFSIGFGPAIWSRRAADGAEYRISWIPFGGYVLLPQLADLEAIEGKSEVDAAQLPPVSYLSKLLVLTAGAAFNIVFAFALAGIIWVAGEREFGDTNTTRIGHVAATLDLPDGTKVPSPAAEGGLQVGDIVRAIDGQKVKDWLALNEAIVTGSGRDRSGRPEAIFTVERDGKLLDLTLHPRLSGEDQVRQVGVSQWYDLIVDGFVSPDALGRKLGFEPGDQIVSFDGRPLHDVSDFVSALADNRDRYLVAQVRRGDRRLEIRIPPRLGTPVSPALGIIPTTTYKIVHPSPFAQVGDQLALTFRTLQSLLNPHSDVGLSKMSGSIGIIHIFYTAAEAGLRAVISFTIFVNINLAILNLLPIPVLDGGQILMATIGRLRGRALPTRFVMATQSVFAVLIIMMVVYLSISDIRRWAHDVQADKAAATAATKP